MTWGKVTSPGWPDPTDWIKRLAAQLRVQHENYRLEENEQLRRNRAAAMLADVCSALNELPPIRETASYLPLKDLLYFISDLERGRRHPWADPVNFGGTSSIVSSELEIRAWAHTLVDILVWSGFRPKQAYAAVADDLAKLGKCGRGGRPIGWRSVQQWCRTDLIPAQLNLRSRILAEWNHASCPNECFIMLCNDGSGGSRCVHLQKVAREFAQNVWELPHLRELVQTGGGR